MNNDSENENRLWKLTLAAQYLSVSRASIYKMVDKGLIKPVLWHIDGDKPVIRVEKSELDKFIEQHRQ